MKKLVILFFTLCFTSFLFAQDKTFTGTSITKDKVCHGAAISVAGTIRPFAERNFSKAEIKEMLGDFVAKSISDSPDKAYDLFKSGKNLDQVVAILRTDFMKLDEATVMQGLIIDTDDYDDYEYENDDQYGDD